MNKLLLALNTRWKREDYNFSSLPFPWTYNTKWVSIL